MIELTEGVIIDNPDRVVEKICRLKKMGLRVSIDDFGTGYSSLNYLKRLPLDELKIDRSFIQEITNDHSDVVITETIISMAKNFGYTVIAEGVETVEQKEILIDKGCRYFQGFLFSKPLPPSDIPEYLKQLTPSSDADSPVEHNP
jgi:sensor c-di-GMP phosphodiesterase-like protein